MLTFVYTAKGKLNGESQDIEGEPAAKLGRKIERLAERHNSEKINAAEFDAALAKALAPYEKSGMEISYMFGVYKYQEDFALRLGEPSWFGLIYDEDDYMSQVESRETILEEGGRLYEIDEDLEETDLSLSGKTFASLDACYIAPMFLYSLVKIGNQPLDLKTMAGQLDEMSTAMESCSGFGY